MMAWLRLSMMTVAMLELWMEKAKRSSKYDYKSQTSRWTRMCWPKKWTTLCLLWRPKINSPLESKRQDLWSTHQILTNQIHSRFKWTHLVDTMSKVWCLSMTKLMKTFYQTSRTICNLNKNNITLGIARLLVEITVSLKAATSWCYHQRWVEEDSINLSLALVKKMKRKVLTASRLSNKIATLKMALFSQIKIKPRQSTRRITTKSLLYNYQRWERRKRLEKSKTTDLVLLPNKTSVILLSIWWRVLLKIKKCNSN